MEFREREGISFEESELRYAELKRRHDAGEIDEEHFDTERQRWLVRDDEGRWWAKCWETGQWLYHDGGGAWIEATPPVYRQVSSGGSPGQTARRPPAQSGSLTGLWIGAGISAAFVVLVLILVIANAPQTGSETVSKSKPTNEKKEEKKDEEKQKAPSKSTPAPSSAPAAGDISIASKAEWRQTPLTLQQGDRFEVRYSKEKWTVDHRNFPYVGPEGYPPDIDRRIYQGCKVVDSLPYATLLGKVGNGSIFAVGEGGEFTADASGALSLRINDDNACLGDNAGELVLDQPKQVR